MNADTDKGTDKNTDKNTDKSVVDNNDEDEPDDADDEDNDDDNEGTQEETETVIETMIAPENYVPVYLLAFVLLGPPSDEPAPQWNVEGAAPKRLSPAVRSIPVTPASSAIPSSLSPQLVSPGTPAFSLGDKGNLSRSQLAKLQDEHNQKRAGDKSGNLISKRPRHEEEASIAMIRMNVAMEKKCCFKRTQTAHEGT